MKSLIQDQFKTPVQSYNSVLNQIPRPRGHIELVMGCMFAGKSTELIRRVNKHAISGKRILFVKFQADTRYDVNKITTHNKEMVDARGVLKLSELNDSWKSYDVIGIDEGQFFTDIVEFAELFANNGKIVIISSLSGTFLRGSWQNILALIPKCEKIKKLSAVCKQCKQSASFTFRTAPPEQKNLIGGEDSYMPLCRQCHLAQSQKLKFQGNPEDMNQDIETYNKNQNNTKPATKEDSFSQEEESSSTAENIQDISGIPTDKSNQSPERSPDANSFSLSMGDTPQSSNNNSQSNTPDQLSE